MVFGGIRPGLSLRHRRFLGGSGPPRPQPQPRPRPWPFSNGHLIQSGVPEAAQLKVSCHPPCGLGWRAPHRRVREEVPESVPGQSNRLILSNRSIQRSQTVQPNRTSRSIRPIRAQRTGGWGFPRLMQNISIDRSGRPRPLDRPSAHATPGFWPRTSVLAAYQFPGPVPGFWPRTRCLARGSGTGPAGTFGDT
eukprot:gene13022-biopygen6091